MSKDLFQITKPDKLVSLCKLTELFSFISFSYCETWALSIDSKAKMLSHVHECLLCL